ncbi:MAG: hypothetical protein F6K09_22665 [Merismopedia sp. SIO2A8]|nr:hypothetical protein [Symploca sp. SIO2B6]NET51417.1 hypothetical protein [Merismopedia sp. SIO2A8]
MIEQKWENFILSLDTEGLQPVIARLSGIEKLLLVVDQFEEVFTVCPKEEDRRLFIELLTRVIGISNPRLSIVTTIRADFLASCLEYESLTQLIQNQAVFIPPLVSADLEAAITAPAKLQGYQLENGLLGAILDDIGQEKGCLPLLQFALKELWEQRDRQKHRLSLTKYQQLGGVIGSLNRRAEEIYESFTEEQDFVKVVFLKLVRTGTNSKDTRQRQPKSKLLAISGDDTAKQKVINTIIDQLVQKRLLVTGKEQDGEAWVDLAHEALMERWERFSLWRQENRELRRLIDRIENALWEWSQNPRNENLMMGNLLTQARQQWSQLEAYLPFLAKEFYQRSDAYEQERTTALQQVREQNVAFLEKKADKVLSFLTNQPIKGLVLAIQAVDLSLEKLQGKVLSQVLVSLQKAVEAVQKRKPADIFKGHEGLVSAVVFSRDGQFIVSGGHDGAIRLWGLQEKRLIKTFWGHDGPIESVALSPDCEYIVSASWDNTVWLWNWQGQLIEEPFLGHQHWVMSVDFSRDGKYIISGSLDQTIRLWDRQGKLIGEPFKGHKGPVFSVAFSPDNQHIVSGSADKTLRLWNWQGQPIREPWRGHRHWVMSIDFSQDGEYIT